MSFALSLRPWPLGPKETVPLEASIKRIHEERGHFRNITEQTLQEEIETNAERPSDAESPDNTESGQDVEARRKELYAARAELLKHASQAQNEALTVLDFISLLISKDAPKQAELSMSPFLKETIKPASIAVDRVPSLPPSKAEEDRAKAVSTGWNLRSLKSTADKLLNSATRLEKEMEKEARYWEQVLSISEKGWSVCKIPREGHTLGVRFGFSEAAPGFGARGLAALRPDNTGNIVLDRGLYNQAKSIRVRLAKDGLVVATSTLPSSASNSQATIETVIHQARDSLFEEELYQELTREARTLMSYGVKVVNDEIRFSTRAQYHRTGEAAQRTPLEIIIDQVTVTEHVGQADEDDFGRLAEGLAIALRILLAHTHRHKFFARSHSPPPISNEKRTTPIQDIIRPLMSHVRHSEAVANLHAFLTRLTQTLRSAQLDADFSVNKVDGSAYAQQETSAARIESLISVLDMHLSTTIRVNLPMQVSHVIVIKTRLSAAEYGTSFRLTLDPSFTSPGKSSTVEFSSIAELCDQVSGLVRQSVAKFIAQQNPAWALEPIGYHLRRVGDVRVKRLEIGLQNGRLALLFSESSGEAPVILAVWQDAPPDTEHQGISEVASHAGAL